MKNNCNTRRSIGQSLKARATRGFTMLEVLIVIVLLGLLAAFAVPTLDRAFDATGDTTKTNNAKVMTQMMEAAHNAGIDTTTYTTSAAAITAMTTGLSVPATVPGGTTQTLKLNITVNPAAYTYTAATATTPAKFTPILGVRGQRP